jgi:hypothetical protein
MRDWSGRAHVETLRQWPELSETVERIEARRKLFLGALLLGSLARGEGDAISDVDLVAVTHPDRWHEAWAARHALSADALVTFDRFEERRPEIGGHSWLTSSLIKVECLVSAPGRMRLRGDAVVVVGDNNLLDVFEKAPSFTRQEIDDYAAGLRETNAISDIERAYGDLIELLRREVRSETRLASSSIYLTRPGSVASAPRSVFGSLLGPRIDSAWMTVEQAKQRLLALIDQNDGYVGAAIIEADSELAENREVASAAAHALATEPGIITGEETDGRAWFPYSFLMRTEEIK